MVANIIFYKEAGGSIPILIWLEKLPEKALAKCLNRLERLREQGHKLRRPEADFLRDGIYELRVKYLRANYRILYFFHGPGVAVISHGLIKESEVPDREIELALKRMQYFKSNPIRYSAHG